MLSLGTSSTRTSLEDSFTLFREVEGEESQRRTTKHTGKRKGRKRRRKKKKEKEKYCKEQMVDYPANVLLPSVLDSFPTSIILKDGSLATRKVLVIDEPGSGIAPSGQVCTWSGDRQSSNSLLTQFLQVLDLNLGPKYRSVSATLYGNTRSWTENKLEEMQTMGLVYVGYFQGGSPLMYLSFLLTDEPDFLPDPVKVVYLYEIQLLPQVQGQRLGTQMLQVCLKNTVYSLSRLDPLLKGIELTVFSDNKAALHLYYSIGMVLAPGSPTDEIATSQRRTRYYTTDLQTVSRPDYYLMFLPV